MKKVNCTLVVLKYMLFAMTAVVLILLWNIVFILQGGIGLEANFILLPVTLLPILLYSTFSCWLILKMFDYKEKVSQKRKISFAVGILALVLSLTFQNFILSKRTVPFVFKNEMFSHLPPIKVTYSFPERIALSSAEFTRLISLETIGTDSTSFIANMIAESAFATELRKLFTNNNLQRTCKNYVKRYQDYNSCVIDIQKEIHSEYTFSSTGNILLIAIGAIGIFETKELTRQQDKEEDIYTNLKITNDIIECSMLSAQKSKEIVLNKNHVIHFSMGHKLAPASLLTLIEHQINYKSLRTFIKEIEEIISSTNEKLSPSQSKDQKVEHEKDRLKKLNAQFLAFQEEGFTVERLKEKEEMINLKIDKKIKNLEDENLILQVAAFFDLSISEIATETLYKREN